MLNGVKVVPVKELCLGPSIYYLGTWTLKPYNPKALAQGVHVPKGLGFRVIWGLRFKVI